MSVPSTDLKHKYEGTGAQTEWPFTFKVFDKTQLLVKKIVGSVETELVLDVDYTVAGAGSDTGGGTVTYPIVGTALAVGEYIVIKPNFEFSQDLVLRNQNTFPPKPVEYAFDKVVMLLKQVKESLDRALLVSDAYDGDADSFITLITSTSSEILASLSGTSTTSLEIGTGSKTFVTQSGKTWSVGQRLRAVSDDATKLMEGEVTAYSGTSLTLAVDFTEGVGTHAHWNISLTGARGASGAGSGDLLAANNGSDFADKPTTFDNLKQAATNSYTGVMRIATEAEVISGLVTNASVTPETLQAKIDALPTPSGIIVSRQVFTSSGTWTKPANLLYADVQVVGGGGGGGGANSGSSSGTNGSDGGTSSFGAHCSASGGGGGQKGGNPAYGGVYTGGAGGSGSGGNVNITGGDGGSGDSSSYSSYGGAGGASFFGGGGRNSNAGIAYGSGGGAGGNAGHGGAGGYSQKIVANAYLGSTETVTIGSGGSGTSGNSINGGAGKAGIIIVTEYRSA